MRDPARVVLHHFRIVEVGGAVRLGVDEGDAVTVCVCHAEAFGVFENLPRLRKPAGLLFCHSRTPFQAETGPLRTSSCNNGCAVQRNALPILNEPLSRSTHHAVCVRRYGAQHDGIHIDRGRNSDRPVPFHDLQGNQIRPNLGDQDRG